MPNKPSITNLMQLDNVFSIGRFDKSDQSLLLIRKEKKKKMNGHNIA